MPACSNLLKKLSRELFSQPCDAEEFVAQFSKELKLGQALVWTGARQSGPWSVLPPLPWQPDFIERLGPGQKPGKHPWHADGLFYCLDFSSVFSAFPYIALRQQLSAPLVCDVCAAPGGKGILAAMSLKPELLVSNEVIKKRTGALISNLKRCRIGGALVTSIDSSGLARLCKGAFDLVIVDAPCSGQSLLVRGERSPGCFHPATINLNSNRQKRILANSAALVAPGGYLSYMTCTFSRRENEGVLEWLMKKFPCFKPVTVDGFSAYQSHLAEFPCYRLWPQLGLGAGAFTAIFQNEEDGPAGSLDLDSLHASWGSL